MQRTREIFTPAARSKISHAVHGVGVWRGKRGGFKMSFKLLPPTLDDNRIRWKVKFAGKWISGRASTVFDATEAIERKTAQS